MWFGAPLSEWLLLLYCTEKVLVLDLFRDVLVQLPKEKAHNTRDVVGAAMAGTLQLWRGMGATGLLRARSRAFYGHDVLVQRFVDSVRGSSEPPTSATDGWKVVELMEEILTRSSRSIYSV